jgi:hypothetical protein
MTSVSSDLLQLRCNGRFAHDLSVNKMRPEILLGRFGSRPYAAAARPLRGAADDRRRAGRVASWGSASTTRRCYQPRNHQSAT